MLPRTLCSADLGDGGIEDLIGTTAGGHRSNLPSTMRLRLSGTTVTTRFTRMNSGYLHGHDESVLRSHRSRTVDNSAAYLAPWLEPWMYLLDIGSGPGTITVDLAGRVARVTAVENTDAAMALTRAEALRAGVEVACVVTDVHALDLPDDSFDVVHAHQVLQHVTDPVTALREMRRVCRPGGIVAVRDSDYHGFVWAPSDPLLDRWLELYDAAARIVGGEPCAGRHLLGWAQQAGFTDITATSSTWCHATPATRQWWGQMWADRVDDTALTTRILDNGLATRDELDQIVQAWRDWATAPDGWFSVLHGEIIARA